jgi:hypothetical protein
MSIARIRAVARPCSSATVLLAIAACDGGPSLAGPVDGNAAMAHVEALVAIGPRPFGSDNLGKAADYICAEIRKIGLEPKRHEPVDEKEQKRIRNLYVQRPILMIGAHYDTKLTEGHGTQAHNFPFVGAIDGGGAPAVLIELARCIQARQPRLEPNVWLYWIDAEESIDFHWKDERALLGSKAFCRWLSQEKILPRVKAFVLIDLIGDEDIKIDRDGNSNKELQQIFEKVAAEHGVGDRVYKYESRFTDDHEVFRDYSVPSVLLIDFEHRVGPERWKELNPRTPHPDPQGYAQWWHTPDDTLDKMSPASLAFAGNLVYAALPELEQFVLKKKR